MATSPLVLAGFGLVGLINAANSPRFGHELAAMRPQIRNRETWMDWLADVFSAAT
jgi:hypothetical protein